VGCPQKIQVLAGFKRFAFPTAFKLFLLATLPNLAERWTAASSAGFVAAQSHHGAENRVAFFVIFEFFEKWNC
jgi:hypothetical protein